MTIPVIPKSWMRLNKFDIVEYPENDNIIFFVIPPELYPDIFAQRFPHIIQKSRRKEWCLSKTGALFLSFDPNVLTQDEIEIVKEWKDRYMKYILIGLNKHIQNQFSSELDFCLALDYNFDRQQEKRTPYGEFVYKLKYNGDILCIDSLAGGLLKALLELIKTFSIENPVLSIVPVSSNRYSIPRQLAKAVSNGTGIGFVDNLLYCGKQSLKNLELEAKIKEWDRLYSCSNCVELMDNIAGKTVFLIDDLYQSGTTLWSCAKNMKKSGAKTVISLVCVKTLRDTDNQ